MSLLLGLYKVTGPGIRSKSSHHSSHIRMHPAEGDMLRFILPLSIVATCWASELEIGGHGLTLGEIALGHGGGDIDLGELGGSEHELGLGGHFAGGGHFIPVVKSIGIPVPKEVPIVVPRPVVEPVPQNYPIPVIVPRPVPYQVEKQVFSKVEKKVPTPVEKIIPVKIEKPVPFTVVKHIPVPVAKPVPIKIPIYKTVVHSYKGH